MTLRLLATDLALRLLGFARVRRLVGAEEAAAGPVSARDLETARRLAERVERASYLRLYRVGCLARALVLQRCLARRGIAAELRIGVRREDGRVRAHAWVDCGGLALDPDPAVAARFTPLS